ncbi:hypothetical protein PTKIN_Ptkin17bG0050200 [Pterospermum kingtungense]
MFLDNKWVWNICLRRNLFGWESNQWDQFLRVLNEYEVCRNFSDSIIWKRSTSGLYSARQYCKDVKNNGLHGEEVWKSLWVGMAPSKVEFFCWQVFKGRLAVKECLFSRSLLNINDLNCAFCMKERESVNHLFLYCEFSWKVRNLWCEEWDLDLCFPSMITDFFIHWLSAIPRDKGSDIWKLGFYAILWSLWMARNDWVFNGKGISIPGSEKVLRDPFSWDPPPLGYFKFNFDGATFGQPGQVGVGGVLRDHDESIKMCFSNSIGVADSNLAELMAIREALLLFVQSRWISNVPLIVESDSSNAVKWFSNPSAAPWRFKRYLA